MNRIACFTWVTGWSLAGALSVQMVQAADASLEDVVVTASRVAQPISEVIGSVTVITRKDIEERQAQSLPDLLRGEAGIDIINNGGLGKLSSVFLRGSSSAQTLILVDGVRVGSASAGTTRVEFIPVDQIERIEIVRGPRSSLYGSDAMGGVIQIFTRRNEGINASASVSRYQTQAYSAGVGLKQDALSFSVQGGYQQSEGFNSCNGDPVNFQGCFTLEPDNDGYHNANVSAHVGYDFGIVDVQLSTLYAKGRNDFDGSFTNQTRFVFSAPTLLAHIKATDNLTFTVQSGVTQDRSTDYQNFVFAGRFNTEKRHANVQADWQVAKQQSLTFGVDYLQDLLDSDTNYVEDSRNNKGYYAQYLGRLGEHDQHELSGSVRHDDNEQFGNHQTGSLGWKWFLMGDALAFNAGAGKAFHAPTFNDLYYPFGFGNTNLKPERSNSVEVGLSGRSKWHNWSVQAYQTHTNDLIVFTNNFIPENVSKARQRGVELSAEGRWHAFTGGLNVSLQQPVSRDTGANFNHLLPRRARQTARLDAGYQWRDLNTGATLNYTGVRYDDVANTTRLPSYVTLDLRTDLVLPANFRLQFKLANVFNREYQTVYLYNQPGRTWGVTLRYAR